MSIPRVYKAQECPLEGYEGFTVTVLVNPTGRVLREWHSGTLGLPGCEACAKLNQSKVARGKHVPQPTAPTERRYCAACSAARAMKARACVALFGPALFERPCTNEDEALAILDDEEIPPELFTWLLVLPDRVVNERIDTVLSPNSNGSATTLST